VLANFFLYLTMFCAASSAVALTKTSFSTDHTVRVRLRLTAAACITGFVVFFVITVRLAGLLHV
jgi:hypothetical protein